LGVVDVRTKLILSRHVLGRRFREVL
jgi:hypothetical protein